MNTLKKKKTERALWLLSPSGTSSVSPFPITAPEQDSPSRLPKSCAQVWTSGKKKASAMISAMTSPAEPNQGTPWLAVRSYSCVLSPRGTLFNPIGSLCLSSCVIDLTPCSRANSSMGYHRATYRNEVLIHATPWMNLEDLMLSGRSLPQKTTHCMIPFT